MPAAAELGSLMASGEHPAVGTADREPMLPRGRVNSLTVVIPVRNEAQSIAGLLGELNSVLDELRGLTCEVLVIDDGSSDATRELALANRARVLSHPHSLGNGAAVKRNDRSNG